MKASTLLKVASAVTAIVAVGAAIYSKTKCESQKEIDNETVDTEEVKEDNEVKSVVTEVLRNKQVTSVAFFGIACGFVWLITMPARIGRRAICHYAIEAIHNGNLTMEELIDLAKNVNQEAS